MLPRLSCHLGTPIEFPSFIAWWELEVSTTVRQHKRGQAMLYNRVWLCFLQRWHTLSNIYQNVFMNQTCLKPYCGLMGSQLFREVSCWECTQITAGLQEFPRKSPSIAVPGWWSSRCSWHRSFWFFFPIVICPIICFMSVHAYGQVGAQFWKC